MSQRPKQFKEQHWLKFIYREKNTFNVGAVWVQFLLNKVTQMQTIPEQRSSKDFVRKVVKISSDRRLHGNTFLLLSDLCVAVHTSFKSGHSFGKIWLWMSTFIFDFVSGRREAVLLSGLRGDQWPTGEWHPGHSLPNTFTQKQGRELLVCTFRFPIP